MLAFILFVLGLVLGYVVRCRMDEDNFIEYICKPCERRLDLNWSTRQVLRLFNYGAAKRWDEARMHLDQGIFHSILATFGLMHIVRIEYVTSSESCISYVIIKLYGPRSMNEIKSMMPQLIKDNRSNAMDAKGWHQTFVCGHNVIADYMNGDLLPA